MGKLIITAIFRPRLLTSVGGYSGGSSKSVSKKKFIVAPNVGGPRAISIRYVGAIKLAQLYVSYVSHIAR